MNNRGKDICKELKAVRRQIAEENGIPLEIPECTYHGPCKGTCPRCESEVRYLENALAQKIKMGKVATVAGLALTLGVSGSAAAQSADTVPVVPPSHERETGMCEVTGVVVDERTREPIPMATVKLYKRDSTAMVTQTDFDGRYRFSVPKGSYSLEVMSVGYNAYRRDVVIKRSSENQGVMELVYDGSLYDTYGRPKVDTVKMTIPVMGLVVVTYYVEGSVIDSKTKEALPFVNVVVLKEGKQCGGGITDFDGNFKLQLEEGEYEFVFSSIGNMQKRVPVKVPDKGALKTIELESTVGEWMGEVLIEGGLTPPLIEIGPEGTTSTEVDGVILRVQY